MVEARNKLTPILRTVTQNDIETVANIIRTVMTEFQAVGCGYSSNDAEVDDMYTAYLPERSAFYVVEVNGRILGCGGYAPLSGGDINTCELRKMYFLSELRGTGMGSQMLNLCLQEARQDGFTLCYLETIASMAKARNLYERHGFEYLTESMGSTGHSSCGTWMSKKLG